MAGILVLENRVVEQMLNHPGVRQLFSECLGASGPATASSPPQSGGGGCAPCAKKRQMMQQRVSAQQLKQCISKANDDQKARFKELVGATRVKMFVRESRGRKTVTRSVVF